MGTDAGSERGSEKFLSYFTRDWMLRRIGCWQNERGEGRRCRNARMIAVVFTTRFWFSVVYISAEASFYVLHFIRF